MAETKIGQLLTCVQCGDEFSRRSNLGKTPLRCSDCAAARHREKVAEGVARLRDQGYFRERWAAQPKWQRPELSCDLCDARYVPHVPYQRYCSKTCRAKADSRKQTDARPLYRYARWLRLRAEQLRAEPMCRFCLEGGTETKATVCDHVVPHRGDVEAFWRGPFQSLCVECHNRTKQSIERQAA